MEPPVVSEDEASTDKSRWQDDSESEDRTPSDSLVDACCFAYLDVKTFQHSLHFYLAKQEQLALLERIVHLFCDHFDRLTPAQFDTWHAFYHSWLSVQYCIKHHCANSVEIFLSAPFWIHPAQYHCICKSQNYPDTELAPLLRVYLPDCTSTDPDPLFDNLTDALLNPPNFDTEYYDMKLDLLNSCCDFIYRYETAREAGLHIDNRSLCEYVQPIRDTLHEITGGYPISFAPVAGGVPNCLSDHANGSIGAFLFSRHWIDVLDYRCSCNLPQPPFTQHAWLGKDKRQMDWFFDIDDNSGYPFTFSIII